MTVKTCSALLLATTILMVPVDASAQVLATKAPARGSPPEAPSAKAPPLRGPITPADPIPGRKVPVPVIAPDPSYFASHFPRDFSVITAFTTTLSFMRTEDGIDASGPDCEDVQRTAHPAIIEIVETGNAATQQAATDPSNVVFRETRLIPFDCKATIDPETFRFDKYKAYAWTVYDPGRRDRARWQRIVFSDFAAPIVEDGRPATATCQRTSVLRDGSFMDRKTRWLTASDLSGEWRPATPQPAMGFGDPGFMQTGRSNQAIAFGLRSPIEENRHYDFSVAIRVADGRKPVEVRAYALRRPLSRGATVAQAVLIGKSVPLRPVAGQWTIVALQPWIAGDRFGQVVIEIVYPEGGGPAAEVDRACLTPSTDTRCTLPSGGLSAPTLATDLIANDEELIKLGGVTFDEEVDLGAVSQVYGAYDTATAEWYDEAAEQGLFDCMSLGDGDEEAVNPPKGESDDELAELDAQWTSVGEDFARIELQPYLPDPDTLPERRRDPIVPPVPLGCSMEQTLDPSLPFGGRHIVYVHGLITKHLFENYSVNPLFQEKWPQDATAYFGDGVFRAGAKAYWSEHIRQGLGDVDTPSNSYMTVGYSTNERLGTGIHAVLSQINEAMSQVAGKEGSIASVKDAAANTCFGANGIVLISHSTGALLTSSMLGIAARTETRASARNSWGDLSFLNRAADAHLSFNGALKGSPIAKAGAVAMALGSATAVDMFREWTGIGANGQIAGGTNWHDTVLMDLLPEVASTYWTSVYSDASVPTLTIGGDLPGSSTEARTLFGQLLIRGMDDGVLSASSQFARNSALSAFVAQNPLKLYDLGREPLKALAMVRQSRRWQPAGLRGYLATPHLAPSGMVQSASVGSVFHNPGNTAPNHFPIMQVTSDHYGSTSPGEHGSGPKFYANTKYGIPNYEESVVVFDQEVYDRSLLSSDYQDLNHLYRKKRSIGFHYPSSISISSWFKISIEWSYFEKIIWQRHYHLAQGHESQNAIDYAYRYILR